MNDFNFIIDEPDNGDEPLVPEVVDLEPELEKMTPRKFGQTILKVFGDLGGSLWLLDQAKADPRGFIELLKKVLPRQIEMDNLEGLTVILKDMYGNTLEVTAGGGQPEAISGDSQWGVGRPQIATGGNPDVDVVIKEEF